MESVPTYRKQVKDLACLCRRGRAYDVIFVDQVSAAIPVLLLLTRSKVPYYSLLYIHASHRTPAEEGRLHISARGVLTAGA